MTTTAPTPQTAVTSAGVAVKATVTETGTEYVILNFVDDADTWTEDGDHVKANNPAAAIRKHLDKFPNPPAGTYLAIPARSWKPVRVTPLTVTTLKLEEAK